MDIRLHEKLYSEGISKRKLSGIQKKIAKCNPKLNLFFVTLPLGNQGLLEVYWYPELLQDLYRKMDVELVVVGLAKSREEAFDLIERIVMDVGWSTGSIPLDEYFKEST